MIDFPANPTVGQQFTAAGVTWTWDGTKWTAAGLGVAYLPLAGGTMLGPIVLAADPTTALGAATRQYVDGGRLGDNRIINGNFAINQRTYVSGTALAAAAYGHDRWKAGTGGCTYTFTAAIPDTTVTITAGTLTQVIEAGMIEGGVYTLSWTGTAQARVYQGTPTGAYAASPLTTASLTAGTNVIVEFNAGTVVRAKLEIGSVATPFNRQSLAKSLADCQRYYCDPANGSATTATQIGVQFPTASASYTGPAVYLPITMRATPTITLRNQNYGNASALTAASISPYSFGTNFIGGSSVGGGYINFNFTANAEL